MELWEGGRFTGEPPKRTVASQIIEVWFNWELIGSYRSYEEARGMVRRLLKTAPVSLHDLEVYLTL